MEVTEGKSTRLEVQAVTYNEIAVSYQWYKDGSPLSDDGI